MRLATPWLWLALVIAAAGFSPVACTSGGGNGDDSQTGGSAAGGDGQAGDNGGGQSGEGGNSAGGSASGGASTGGTQAGNNGSGGSAGNGGAGSGGSGGSGGANPAGGTGGTASGGTGGAVVPGGCPDKPQGKPCLPGGEGCPYTLNNVKGTCLCVGEYLLCAKLPAPDGSPDCPVSPQGKRCPKLDGFCRVDDAKFCVCSAIGASNLWGCQ